MSKDLHYRPDIDGLRAIAVSSVVLFHIGAPHLDGGFVGVDIFFVISGFLITKIIAGEIERGEFSVVKFYERRIRRIFPALFAMLIVSGLIATAILMPLDFQEFSASAVATALFSSNIFFWLKSGYFDQAAELKPLLHTWSLAVEEQYYTVFPLFMALTMKRWIHWRWALLAVTLASLALSVVMVRTDPSMTFYLPFSRFWELLIGSLIAVGWPPAIKNLLARQGLSLLGLGMILYSIATYTAQTRFPGETALLPCVGAALILYADIRGPTLVGRLLSLKPFIWLGLISYSLYLWHWPVLVFTRYVLMRPLTVIDKSAVFLAVMVLAYLSWRFIERPFRRARHVGPVALFAGAGVIATVIIGAGLYGYLQKGVPERFPPAVRHYALASQDINPRRQACDQRPVADVAANRVCTLGADVAGPPTFAVLGDSFGDAMIPGVDSAGNLAGRKGLILTHSGCYALVGVDQGNAECQRQLAASIALIQRSPSIKTVIMIGRWTTAVHGKRFGALVTEAMYIRDSESGASSYDENRRVFARSMTRTIDGLRPRNVVVMAYIPEQAVDVPRAAALTSYFNPKPDIGVARAAYDARQAPVHAILEPQSRALGFTVLDATPVLCDARRCAGVSGDQVLYVDDNHLSRTGAERFAPLIADALRRF
ncbi:acyltransferase family protein [soil metagenome]